MNADNALQRDVLDELEWGSGIHAAAIGVSVKDGVVRLTGDVQSWAEQVAVEQAVKRVAGVKAVANDLKVRLPHTHQRTDAAIAQAVVHALEWDVAVPSEQIKPTVSNGHVTLEGEVNSHFQRMAAERAVRYLTGVTGVSNLIDITFDACGADVHVQIERAFRRCAELDAQRIQVDLHDGIVVLHGTVNSWAEHAAAERAALAAPGVTRVENHLAIVV